MPFVIIPVAIAAATAAIGVGLGAVTLTAAVFSVAATAVSAGIGYLTTPAQPAAPQLTGNAGASNVGAGARQPTINDARPMPIRQPLPPRRFVYGHTKVGGAVLFQNVDETDGNYLLIVSALSDGVIETVEKFYLGADEVVVDNTLKAVSGTRFYQRVTFEYTTGTSTQPVSPLVQVHCPTIATATWTQTGIARGVVRLEWGADATTHNYVYGTGIEPSYLIKGVRVYDPRDAEQSLSDSTTWVYSDNPALCVAHAITNAWGSAISADIVNWSTVAEAATDCDDVGFTLAGIVQSDVPLAGQLADMLSSFGGSITYENGLYCIRADKARDSVWTVTDSDILQISEMQFEADAAAHFGSIKGIYYNAADEGQRTTSPVQVIDASNKRETSVDLPFVSDSTAAQILARRKLIYDRDGGGLNLQMSDAALDLVPTDVFTISSNAFPFANGKWQVLQVDIASIGAIVTARRYVPEAYAKPSTYVI